MSASTKQGSANLNFQLFSFLFLVLLSEVILVYTTYNFIKSQLSTNCEKSCTENEIWEVINSEKFSAIMKEKIEESLHEVTKGQQSFSNRKKSQDSISIRTRRNIIGFGHHPGFFMPLPPPLPVPTVVCPPGPPGPQGPTGFTGYTGLPGAKGEMGSQGVPGLSGIPGTKGEVGMPGPPGLPGTKGNEGSRGQPGLSGIQGTKGDLGMPGPPGLPGTKGNEGSRGSPGLTGIPGTKGDLGMPGLPGFPGTKGDEGSTGQPGLSGIQGRKGEVGMPGQPGLPGTNGNEGSRGPPGPIGIPGPKGDLGIPGLPGLPGTKGDVGARGPPGLIGIPGPIGQKGLQGLPGFPCNNGAEDCRGVVGLPGQPGSPGPMGPPGPKGDCASDKPDNKLPIQVSQYGNNVYPDLLPKKIDNVISGILKHRFTDVQNNRISMPELSLKRDTQMLWEAKDTDSYTLLEYNNIANYRTETSSRVYELFQNFDSGSKVIYDEHFYYKSDKGRPGIIRYSLEDSNVQSLGIPGVSSKNLKNLYKSKSTYFDFNVDENGLWVIFAVPNNKNTGILKINTNDMTIEKAWNIALDHTEFDGMFIDSGILYPLKDLTIPYACDLYKNKCFTMDLTLERGPTTTTNIKLWYNPKTRQLCIRDENVDLEYYYSVHLKKLHNDGIKLK